MPKKQQSQKRRTDQREARNGECKTRESENSAATRAEEEEEEESEREESHTSQGYDGGTTVPARNGGTRK